MLFYALFLLSQHLPVIFSAWTQPTLHFAQPTRLILITNPNYPGYPPHSQWAIQQLRETFAFDETTKYVIRDNDRIFSEEFKRTIKRFGLKDKPTAFRSPWQNGTCERVIGTLRRECLDHIIVLNEKHLRSVLTEFVAYYNTSRTHLSLEKDSPVHRPIQTDGKIVSKSILGGLHHIYRRVA